MKISENTKTSVAKGQVGEVGRARLQRKCPSEM